MLFRSGIWGWMFFDWAAQPFFTVVTTFIFGPYFVSRLTSDPAMGQAVWGYGLAAAGFVIAVLSPVLGSIADQTGPRRSDPARAVSFSGPKDLSDHVSRHAQERAARLCEGPEAQSRQPRQRAGADPADERYRRVRGA